MESIYSERELMRTCDISPVAFLGMGLVRPECALEAAGSAYTSARWGRRSFEGINAPTGSALAKERMARPLTLERSGDLVASYALPAPGYVVVTRSDERISIYGP